MELKNILLVKLEDSSQVYPPFGLMYLAAALRSEDYKFEIFHETVSSKNLDKLYEKAKNADIVAFSVMTSPVLIKNLQVSKKIKEMGKPIVWGGMHPTMIPETTLKDDCVDYIILGDGEETFIKLLECLKENKEPEGIKGIGYKKGKELIVNGISDPIKDLDKYHLDWDDVEVERYIQPRFGKFKRVLPIITSRGCPHGCTFCYNHVVNKRRWRAHSSDYVIKELKKLKEKYRLDAVFFGDDNFFTRKDRAFEIVKELDLPWMADVRVDYINEEFVKKAKELKSEGFYVGVESGSDRILKDVINKGINVKQIDTAIGLCEKYGIKVESSLIVAFPSETKTEIRRTMSFMYYLYKKYDNVFFWAPKIYTPYPGTPLYFTSLDYGLQAPKSSREWATNLKIYECNLPWISKKVQKKIGLLYLMVGLAQMKKNLITLPFKKLEEWRWRNLNLFFPIELEFAALVSRSKKMTQLFFKYFRKH
jgi:anaerobic magnesium-protoporphyrin IX monomethyl ester cyclase